MTHRARYIEVNAIQRHGDLVQFVDQDGESHLVESGIFEQLYVPIVATTATIGGDLG